MAVSIYNNRLNSRFQILDIYRGIAIILVLFRHHEVFPFFNKIGWVGVSLFFVLSGYLISSILFKELKSKNKINIKRFYIRRGFRIYPGFYLFTGATSLTLLLLYLVTGHQSERLSIISFLVECFFLQNYFHGQWHHTWSIAVEEHFYLIFPLLLICFKAEKVVTPSNFFGGVLFLILLITTIRCYSVFQDSSYEIYRNVFYSHIRLEGLIMGVIIGFDEWFNSDRIKSYITKRAFLFFFLTIILILPSLIYYMESPYNLTIGFTLLSLGFSILIIYSLNFKAVTYQNIIYKAMAVIGTWSYAIYLWHGYINSFIMRFIQTKYHLQSNSLLDFILLVTLSLLFGWLITEYFEKYFLGLRNKYFPST